MLDDSDYVYTIGGSVVFNPKDNTLINLEGNKQTTLYLTCSRCLSILLENRNSIVSQNEILEFAWPDNHRSVSYNTFYQCVLNLRKAFNQIDYYEKIIITVPKKGLSVASGIMITKVENYHASNISMCLDSNSTMIGVADEGNSGNDKESLTKDVFLKKREKIYTTIILLTAFFIVVIISSYYYLNDNFFSNYTEYVSSTNHCHVYMNDNESSVTQIESFIEREKDICKGNYYVYLTLYENAMRASAVVCKRKLNYFTNNSCVSHYYPAYESVHE
jgi:DNA-binding winged helix-turn-helix (wHTH) protein